MMNSKRYALGLVAALLFVLPSGYAQTRSARKPRSAPPVVEVGILPIKPDAEAKYRKAYFDTLPTLTKRAGYITHRWGKRVEGDSLTYIILVEWQSVEAHKAFANSPEYPAYVGAIKDFLSGEPQFFHVNARESFAPVSRK